MTEQTRDQQRAELHKAIWRVANDLRGSVDGWDFKQYILTTLFYRYISEDLERFVNDWEAQEGAVEFSYADMSDADAEAARGAVIDARGYFMLPSQLFKNVCVNAKSDKNLNETIEGVFRAIEESSVGHYAEKDFRVLRRNKPTTDVLFINAERDFGHEGNKNKLREHDIEQIVKWHTDRANVEYAVRSVPQDEIAENEYSLDVGVYIEEEDTSEHLTMSEIQEWLDECVKRESELRAQLTAILQEAGVMQHG